MEAGMTEWGNLGLNGAAVLFLYGMSRDIRELAGKQVDMWRWIERIRRHLWPSVFSKSE